MGQNPSWEANWSAASQETPRISRNPKVHYRTHKRPPTVSILGQPKPVHIPTSHLLEIQPNIIHPSTPRSHQWSPSRRFPHQDRIYHPLLTHTRHMHSPSHSSRFYHPHNIEWGYKSFSSSLCNRLHSPVTSSALGPNILLKTLFSNTPCAKVGFVSTIRAGRSEVQFRQGQEIFRLSSTPRCTLESNQPPINVGANLFPGFKRLGREVDHSAPFSAELRNKWR